MKIYPYILRLIKHQSMKMYPVLN